MPTATEMSTGALMKFRNGLPGFRTRLPFPVHMSGGRKRPRPRGADDAEFGHGFRAKQHIFDVVKTLCGPGNDPAAQWGKVRRDQLDKVRLDLVIVELPKHAGRCPHAARTETQFSRKW